MDPDQDAARDALGLDRNGRIVTILPGSRLSELKYNSRVFIETAAQLAKRDPTIKFIIPMAGETQRAYFEQLIARPELQRLPLTIMTGNSHEAIAACDAALVASGTATLEAALFKRPMVIAYRMNPLSWQIMRRQKLQPWVGLPNILAAEFLVPEFLQDQAKPEALGQAVLDWLNQAQQVALLQQRFVDMHHSLLRDTAQLATDAIEQTMAR